MSVQIHQTLRDHFKENFPEISSEIDSCANYNHFVDLISTREEFPKYFNRLPGYLHTNEGLDDSFKSSLATICDLLIEKNQNLESELHTLNIKKMT
jgi:hypothetical protein